MVRALIAILVLPLTAYADGLPLFNSDDTLQLTIEAPIRSLVRNAEDRPVVDGTATYIDVDGASVTLPVQVSTRGKSRLTVCRFPPLSLSVKKKDAAGTVFEGQKSLKIVTHCQSSNQFRSYLNDLASAPWLSEVDAVLTGYLATEEQVIAVAEFISLLKDRNPNLIYVCDPVIGDRQGLYVSPDIASAIKSNLIPVCDVTTPNRYELEWLTQSADINDPARIAECTRKLGAPLTLVTSATGMMRGNIANIFRKFCKCLSQELPISIM